MSSINRDLAKSMGAANAAGTLTSTGEISGAAGMIVVSTADSLPVSAIAGDRAFVDSSNRYYIHSGSGWYNIALINNTPTFSSLVDSDGDSVTTGTFILPIDGTAVNITVTATDPEGVPITYTATTGAGFDSIATISQDGQVFTITPFSEDSAGDTTESTVTFKASDGVNVATALRTFTLTFKIPNSQYSTTLVKASGNGGTNTTINDASTNNHTITANNGPTNQSFTPHHPGGYSTYFDGSGDYLDLDFNAIGTSDFTIEAWVYITDSSANQLICDFRPTSTDNTTGMNIQFRSDNVLYVGSYNVAYITGSTTYSDNTWVHVALVRNGSTLTLYGNGISQGSTSHSVNLTSTDMRIGTNRSAASVYNGYIRDFRLVKGAAVYTSNFTPPTIPLTAITNTEILTCHLPYIGDGSSNGHPITINGDTAIKRVGPYDYPNYDPSAHGSSVYFDGTNDQIIVPAAAWDRDADYTVECWMYPTSYHYVAMSRNRYAADGIIFSLNQSTGEVFLGVGRDNVDYWDLTYTGSVDIRNRWNHLALTHDASEKRYKIYINGVNVFNGTSSYHPGSLSSVVNIGCAETMNSSSNNYGTGWISDHRITDSIVYTSDFTPPTAPLSTISGTTLHTCNDSPDVYDVAVGHRVGVDGSAGSSTSQTKYASSSIYVPENDLLQVLAVDNGDASTQPGNLFQNDQATIEWWVRTGSSTFSNAKIFMTSNWNHNWCSWLLYTNSNKLVFYASNTASSWNVFNNAATELTFSANTWHHMAIVKNGTHYTFFKDGNQTAQLTTSAALSLDEPNLYIGADTASTDGFINAYFEDIRVTNGLARYPFIPAKRTFTSGSNVEFITAHAASITDGSGNSHSITTSGAVVSDVAPASGMKSVYFDGNDYLRADTALDFGSASSQAFTIEAWIYWESAPSGFEACFGLNGASDGRNHLLIGGESSTWRVNWEAQASAANTGVSISTGTWYHLAATYDGTDTLTLFIDGTKVYSVTDSTTVSLSDNVFLMGTEADGANGGSLGNYFNGYMSNIRVSSTVQYTNSFIPSTSELLG